MGSKQKGRRSYARTELRLEQLEARELMAADTLTPLDPSLLLQPSTAAASPTVATATAANRTAGSAAVIPTPITSLLTAPRTIDGTGNNLSHLQWGTVGQQLLRVAAAEYADGISAPAGADRPSAREISNALSAQDPETALNDRQLSAFIYIWGQFLDHDIDLTHTGGQALSIAVPAGDPEFDPNSTGTATIPLTRSVYDPATGASASSPRQQTSDITAWIDGSMIYGSDATTAASLRTLQGGKLKTSDGGLPPTDAIGNFLAGDERANENIELTSMHALFVREHNQWAAKIAQQNPGLTDEQIYQRARAIVIAEIQAITYNEFLPALLGRGSIDSYRGYNASVNPMIANEFSTAAFRLHTLINDDVEFFGNDGRAVRDEVELRDAFFNPSLLKETGIDSILKYAASTQAQEVDTQIVDGLRNFLFGAPGQGGLDLASLNIQRGRDHGLADFNAVRQAYGLRPVTSFAEITSDVQLQQTLEELYGNVNNIDLWVGVLVEDHAAGASVGPTARAIISDQFERLRDGDRYWYQRAFSGQQLSQLENTTLAQIIRRNTTTNNVQDNVFFMRAEVSGQVYADLNVNGLQDRREVGMAGVTLELIDDEGEVIATTTTKSGGRYRFTDFAETGDYQIRVVPPAGQTAQVAVRDVHISRGGLTLANMNFGLSRVVSAVASTLATPTQPTSLASLDAAFAQSGLNDPATGSTARRRLRR